MSEKAKAAYILRAQPFHKGHLSDLLQAYRDPRISGVTLLIGSANKCRSVKNPWSFEQRKTMIIQALTGYPEIDMNDINILPLNDWPTNEPWYAEVLSKTKDHKFIIGHDKDASSFYLTQFPELEFIGYGAYRGISSGYADTLNATQIREDLFMMPDPFMMATTIAFDECPEGMQGFLKWWVTTPEYGYLQEEYQSFIKDNELFRFYPFPKSLNCCVADPVVVCRGQILLITRAHAPGKGLLALPGGHKDRETFLDCAIRELKEETCIKVPEKVLRGSLKAEKMFDDPSRCQNLVKPSMAYYFELEPDHDGSRPKVKPKSDAIKAEWYPIADVLADPTQLFDDHADIIEYFTGFKQTRN